MDVDGALWLSVWWPAVVAWVVIGLALVFAAWVCFRTWRAHKRFDGVIDPPEIPIYLNEKRVSDIYQIGGYGDAITKQVVAKVGLTKEGKLALRGLSIDAEAAISRGREVMETYMKEYNPIEAIGVVLQGLEAAHGILHINLNELTVARNTAFTRHLGTAGDVRADQLPQRCYVSVTGVFRVENDPNGERTFLASIGDSADGTTGAWTRITCDEKGLRDDTLLAPAMTGGVVDDTLYARCLGKVQAWRGKNGTQELVIRPVAIFL